MTYAIGISKWRSLPLYGEDEDAKKMTRSVLAYVLDNTMRLLHPFMPFITEEIWQNLPHQGESITVAAWPQIDEQLTDQHAAGEMKLLMDIIRAVRNIRAEVNTPMGKKIKLMLKAKDIQVQSVLEKNEDYIKRFCNPEELHIAMDMKAPEKAMTAVVTGVELFLPLEGLINIDEEIARLEKEWDKWDKEVDRVRKNLLTKDSLAKLQKRLSMKNVQKKGIIWKNGLR